ncbi:DUF2809 domain-containing protein [Leifsonia sp. NPDC077715]|uniref:ribosomal maturation YjgA family protein n=1 Tax=Leifsonia sp. NPDC077715 TaxID=3155539 RepID=UPI00341A26D4
MARRRIALALTAAALIAAGLVVARTTDSAAWTFVGDALYAAMLYAVAGAVLPRAAPPLVGAIAFGVSAAVEFFQLTGIPGHLATVVPGAALVLGTTFQGSDLVAYALGAGFAVAADVVIRRATGSSRGERTTPSAGAPPPRPPAGTPSR